MVTTTPSLSQQRKGTCKNDHHSPSPFPRRALGYVAMITTAPSLSQKRKDMCGYDQHHASHRRTIIYGHDHHPFFSHERKRPSAGRQGSDLARRRPSPGLSSKLGLSSPSQKRKGAYGHDHHPGHARPLPRRGRGCVAMITATPSLSQKKKVVCVDDNHSPPLPMRGRVYIDHHHKVIYGHGH